MLIVDQWRWFGDNGDTLIPVLRLPKSDPLPKSPVTRDARWALSSKWHKVCSDAAPASFLTCFRARKQLEIAIPESTQTLVDRSWGFFTILCTAH